MAKVYQTYREKINPDDRTREYVLNSKGERIPHSLWWANIIWHDGKRKKTRLATGKAESQKMADQLQQRENEIRLGLRALPTSADKNGQRSFIEVADEYLAWGKAQGGRKGRAWSATHAFNRKRQLKNWKEILELELLCDIYGCLPKVEAETRRLLDKGLTGRSVSHEIEAISSFCRWCRKRKYLSENPLEELGRIDKTPRTPRRALTHEEFVNLLQHCSPQLRLLYITAACTGFRANELRNLSEDDLDAVNTTIRLKAEFDKARKERFQPIPSELATLLVDYIRSGEAKQLYAQIHRQQGKRKKLAEPPINPLLYVPRNCGTLMIKDMEKAGIKRRTAEGKIDFHAIRTAYINFIIKMGTDVKTITELARHENIQTTMMHYAKADKERLKQTADAMAFLLPQTSPEDAQPGFLSIATKKHNPCYRQGLWRRNIGADKRTWLELFWRSVRESVDEPPHMGKMISRLFASGECRSASE